MREGEHVWRRWWARWSLREGEHVPLKFEREAIDQVVIERGPPEFRPALDLTPEEHNGIHR